MPPKNSKKEVKNIQKKVIDDKTFGLKNKNKSKVAHLPRPSTLPPTSEPIVPFLPPFVATRSL